MASCGLRGHHPQAEAREREQRDRDRRAEEDMHSEDDVVSIQRVPVTDIAISPQAENPFEGVLSSDVPMWGPQTGCVFIAGARCDVGLQQGDEIVSVDGALVGNSKQAVHDAVRGAERIMVGVRRFSDCVSLSRIHPPCVPCTTADLELFRAVAVRKLHPNAAEQPIGYWEQYAPPFVLDGTVVSRRTKAKVTFVNVKPSAADGFTQGRTQTALQIVLSARKDPSVQSRFSLMSALMRTGCVVRVKGTATISRGNDLSLAVKACDVTLLRLSPEPSLIQRLVSACGVGTIGRDETETALGCSPAELDELLHAREQAATGGEEAAVYVRKLKDAVVAASRRLKGLPGRKRPARNRMPREFTLREDVASLTRIEQSLGDVVRSESRRCDAETDLCHDAASRSCRAEALPDSSLLCAAAAAVGAVAPMPAPDEVVPEMLYDLSHGAINAVSRGLTRKEYVERKKEPQVRFMVAALAAHVEQARRRGALPVVVHDIGGGRGDLGIAIARAFPAARVYIVDVSRTALECAFRRAKGAGVMNVTMAVTDVRDAEPEERAHIVVGLHACGGLTDAALEYAARANASFLIATCCFCKNVSLCNGAGLWSKELPAADAAVLRRLAESKRRDVSLRAMRVVNSLRLARYHLWPGSRDMHVSLRAFDEAYSLRNLVLEGTLPDQDWEEEEWPPA
eukprot:TRINITY_DN11042_c0_g2_i1.p1 TRINITY_DN11042_c0_g2~~TRINITY_DN11042_c0_g2_i1.p1  ORF type:complete len:683 (+),score=153.10 TRINITY_DN11042_c0_g2_i1:57-2105(+)